MTGIADTGFIVAFLNRRDIHHRWAVKVASEVDEPLITCEAVLAEAAFHLGSVTYVLELLESGLLKLDFEIETNRRRLALLAKRYEDRSPDLADLCLICVSERFPHHPVITIDGDFRIYRRHQRETIPLLMPGK
ncbi:MAG: PIN domain-containing protein [bacterium]